MKSIYDQRRANLRQLIRTWGGPTSLAKKLEHSNGSHIAQLACPNPSREISERVAREMETRLDQEHGDTRQIDDEALGACVRAVAAAHRPMGAGGVHRNPTANSGRWVPFPWLKKKARQNCAGFLFYLSFVLAGATVAHHQPLKGTQP